MKKGLGLLLFGVIGLFFLLSTGEKWLCIFTGEENEKSVEPNLQAQPAHSGW